MVDPVKCSMKGCTNPAMGIFKMVTARATHRKKLCGACGFTAHSRRKMSTFTAEDGTEVVFFPYQWKTVELERVLTEDEFYQQEPEVIVDEQDKGQSLVVGTCDHGVSLKELCFLCKQDGETAIVGKVAAKKSVAQIAADFLKERKRVTTDSVVP